MVGETATMKWTIVPGGNATGIFELSIQKPVPLRISYEINNGTSHYDNTSYNNRLTVVRSKPGNDIIITATLSKLTLNDTNTYTLEVLSKKNNLFSSINLDVKGW